MWIAFGFEIKIIFLYELKEHRTDIINTWMLKKNFKLTIQSRCDLKFRVPPGMGIRHIVQRVR